MHYININVLFIESCIEDIIKLVINFLTESGRFDRPLISFNK